MNTIFLMFLSVSIISLSFKDSFFLILVLFEVCLMLTTIGLLTFGLTPWFILPILGIGACESSLGLSMSVWLSRASDVSSYSV